MSNIKLIYKTLSHNEYLFFIFQSINKNNSINQTFFKFVQCNEQTLIYELIELNNLKQFNENNSINKLKLLNSETFDYSFKPNPKYSNKSIQYFARRFKFKR